MIENASLRATHRAPYTARAEVAAGWSVQFTPRHKAHPWCVSTVSPHHSEDRVEVYSGSATPRRLCGYHAMREGH